MKLNKQKITKKYDNPQNKIDRSYVNPPEPDPGFPPYPNLPQPPHQNLQYQQGAHPYQGQYASYPGHHQKDHQYHQNLHQDNQDRNGYPHQDQQEYLHDSYGPSHQQYQPEYNNEPHSISPSRQ